MPACAEAGILGALAGVLGSMVALEVIREIVGFGQGLVGRLRDVLRSGERHTGQEVPLRLSRDGVTEERFFNLSYEPMRSEGRTVDSVMSTTVPSSMVWP